MQVGSLLEQSPPQRLDRLGKTTVARKLETEGAIRLALDEWMLRLLGEDVPRPVFEARQAACHSLMLSVARQFLLRGIDVVLDNGYWSRDSRESTKGALEDTGAEVVVYYFETPLEILQSRISDRDREQGNSGSAPARVVASRQRNARCWASKSCTST